MTLLLLFRLFYLQVFKHDYYAKLALRNSKTKEYIYPDRGYIFDRNDTLLVSNQPMYDIMVIPNEIKNLDTISFCKLFAIDKIDFIKRVTKAKKYSYRLASVFEGHLTKNEYARVQELMYNYQGFYVQRRSLRKYSYENAANVLGYIREVNPGVIAKNPYYRRGDLIGISGVEKSYEKILRGVRGVRYGKRNSFGQNISQVEHVMQDTIAEAGKDINLTIDLILQQYGELLMQGKRGAIVALEPKTGEILALVTAPSYEPSLSIDKERRKAFNALFYDSINKPMLDRGLKATYPPGSPFKAVVGLIALQEKVITPNYFVRCHHGFHYGKRAFMACHCGTSGSPVNLDKAIYRSCNTYFASVYRKTTENKGTSEKGLDAWSAKVKKFGFGKFLGVDLPVGSKGFIPDGSFYNRYYPKYKWRPMATLSNAIGQGEVSSTPIQLANMTAAIANRGYYYTPHIVSKIDGKKITDKKYTIPKQTGVDAVNFDPIIKGMFSVYEKQGTGRFAKIKGIKICGKTGTSENYVKANGKRIKMPDHSIFVAFAPKDNPKIALAVFIENGGYGATYAAPIASLMVEKYLRGKITRTDLEWRMLNDKQLTKTYKEIIKLKTTE
jgi:penicillin-binding protein 2